MNRQSPPARIIALEQTVKRVRRERDAARDENRELREKLADAQAEAREALAAFGLLAPYIPRKYRQRLLLLDDIAHNAVRRPDDLGGHVTGTHSQSRPPSYDAAAYDALRSELGGVAKVFGTRADDLGRELRRLHEVFRAGAEEGQHHPEQAA